MVKAILNKVGNKCNSCDETFTSDEQLKDHILSTIPSNGTRNFKYRMNSRKVVSNIREGAKRGHFTVEYKHGATNVDFSDGSWLLTALPEVRNWEKQSKVNFRNMEISIVEVTPGKDASKILLTSKLNSW